MITKALRAAGEAIFLPGFHRAMSRIGCAQDYQRLAYGNHPRQYVLHLPAPVEGAPIAVWFHGGGWQFGSPEKLLAYGEFFHQHGYEVVMASHRRIPRFCGREIYEDACAVMRLTESLHESSSSLLLGGVSSGGHLATICALRQNRWNTRSRVVGLITCAAPLTLEPLGWSPTLYRLAGRTDCDDYAALNPYKLLDHKPDFPAFMMHGTADGFVPYECAEMFWAKASQIGWDSLTTHTIPGGSHLDAARWVLADAET